MKNFLCNEPRRLAWGGALLCVLGLGFSSMAPANEGEALPKAEAEVVVPDRSEGTATDPATDVVAAGAEESPLLSFVRADAPEGEAKSIHELRAAGVQPGERVTVRAQIGGRNPPWLNGLAMMLLADAKELAACTTGACGSPWDFCSAPQDKILQHTGIVRWLDEKGEPRPISFHEVADIAPLSTVIITGTVADMGDPKVLVIDADSFHLEERGPFAALMDEMKAKGTGPYQKR